MALPENPITRKEAYLAKIAGQEVQIPDVPITREEAYLNEIAKNGGGGGGYTLPTATANRLGGVKIGSGISVEEDGTISASGGGGTTDYDDLTNKPSINDVELSGNKTASELGLQNELTFDDVPTDGSNNPVKSGGVYASDEAIRKWTTAEAKSVSGNPITLTDGSARNAEGLEVTCEPVQNLHGYDHPWASGAYINKATALLNAALAVVDNGYKYVSGGSSFLVPCKANITYQILFKNSSSNRLAWAYFDHIPEYNDVSIITGPSTTFTPSADGYLICYRKNAYDETIEDTDMVEIDGTSNTIYPISNICPITGYDECVVTVKDEDDTTHDNATITFGQTVYGGSVDFKTGKVTVTHVVFDMGGEWTYDGTSWDNPVFYRTLSDAKTFAGSTRLMCDIYSQSERNATSNAGTVALMHDKELQIKSLSTQIFVMDTDYNDAAAFATAMSGHYICYKLATPTELTLTPAELELLKGYNYITTNGTTITLDYLPDSLLAEAENYVDAKIPPAPSSDGTYVLTCTVTDGTPAYSWESAT